MFCNISNLYAGVIFVYALWCSTNSTRWQYNM